MIAQAKVDAENWKKIEAAEKRQAAVDAKKWEAFQKDAMAKWNALTPEQRAAKTAEFERIQAEGNARYNAEFQRRSRENSARQRAYGERNVFCHRNFGRSC
jgi:hypothetical protein